MASQEVWRVVWHAAGGSWIIPKYPELGNRIKQKRKGETLKHSGNSLDQPDPPVTESCNLRSSKDWTTEVPDIYNTVAGENLVL